MAWGRMWPRWLGGAPSHLGVRPKLLRQLLEGVVVLQHHLSQAGKAGVTAGTVAQGLGTILGESGTGVGDDHQGQPQWGRSVGTAPVGTPDPPGAVAHLMGAVVHADEQPAVLGAGQQQDEGHVGDNQVQVALGEVIVDVLGRGQP